MRISGLEPLTVDKNLGFMNVGERCNIAGSAKYKKLILNGEYDKALEIARTQAESGAQVIDVNMDEGARHAAQPRGYQCPCLSHPHRPRSRPVPRPTLGARMLGGVHARSALL